MGGKAKRGERYIALMRGLNVGGKNRLPMVELAAVFEEAGCTELRTYIQSGNVLFGASASLAKRLPKLVQSKIARDYGYQVPVVLRRARELQKLAAASPFSRAEYDPKNLYLMCLASMPTAAQVASLDPERSIPDEFVVQGDNVYLHLPNGAARSKLTTAYFDKKLGTTSTVRNWNTLSKLIELSAA